MRLPRHFLSALLFCLGVLSGVAAHAGQYRGDARFFQQPSGATVEVRLFGTELYLRAESPDGYALAIDRPTGWICYAEKDTAGVLQSSGIHYLGLADAVTLQQLERRGITPSLRADPAAISATVAQVRQSLSNAAADQSGTKTSYYYRGPRYAPVLGSGKGLVVLVDFSDRAGTITTAEYEKAFNGDTYDSLGSIRTWIEAISYGKYTASHTVVGYMRAAYPTSHYVGGVEFDYSASQELMKQVFKYIDDNVDLSSYATNNALPSLVVVYPGAEIAKVWATGLWPHAGEGGYTTSEKVKIPNAFISNGGTRTPIDLDTFRHELGHSLFNWPDTYDYDDDSAGAGGFATETTLPCAPFRAWVGWMNVIDVVGLNQAYALKANGDTCLRYKNSSASTEFFMVEYMRKETPKRPDAPDEGLLIWHIDEKGDNNAQDMTATKHYECSVEQADGLFELEKNGRKRTGDLFRAGYKDTFNETTTPNSKWWNGSASGFAVCNVGALDPAMNVTVGCSGPITPVVDAGAAGSGGTTGSGGTSGTGGRGGSGGSGGSGSTRDAGRDSGGRDVSAPDVANDAPSTSGSGGSRGSGGAGGNTTNADAALASGGNAGKGGAGGSGGVQAGGATGGAASGGTQGKGGSGAGGASSSSAGADAGKQPQAETSKSGCSCALGSPSKPGSGVLLLGLGCVAAVAVRRRPRKRH